MTIKDLFLRLDKILTFLGDMLEKIAPLLEREEQHLRDRDPEAIESIGQEIATALNQFHQMDSERVKTAKALGRALQLNLGNETPRIVALHEKLGGKTGLLKHKERIQTLAEKADQINRKNQAMVEGALSAMSVLLKTLSDNASNGGGATLSYNRRGGLRMAQKPRVFSMQL